MSTELKPSTKSQDEIAQAYSSEPWWYDLRGFFILTFSYNSTLTSQMRFFGNNFGPRHLEVACGSGTLLELVLRWRRWKGLPKVKIIGVDYAESMLAGAIRRFADDPDVELKHADAAALPFTSDYFDTVNIANSAHCFPDLDGALRDIFRVMKPGASFALNVLLFPEGIQPFKRIAEKINAWGIRKGILYTPYHSADVKKRLLAAGFELISDVRTGNCYNVLARKPVSTSKA